MIDPNETVASGDGSTNLEHGDPRARLGDELSDGDATADLVHLLSNSPGLRTNRSLVIATAVDEFLALALRNPSLTATSYAQRFACFGESLRSSITRQIEVEQFVLRTDCLQPLDAKANWPLPGDKVRSFEIIEELGRGALARVYLCRQLDVGKRQVVVKICGTASQEAHTLGQLRHANIIPIYSLEQDDARGKFVLCMPFLGRSTLLDLVDVSRQSGAYEKKGLVAHAGKLWEQPTDRVLPATGSGPSGQAPYLPDAVAYIGARLADALHHSHGQGVVHGDIKPSNILITPQGEPLLMDFNLSGNSALATEAPGGTLPYMPPEQLVGITSSQSPKRSNYDARSDVFSLGVVLYELCCGRLPFPAAEGELSLKQAADHLLSAQKAGYVPLRQVNRDVSATLARTVEKCLAWLPNARFQSAAEVRDAFLRELTSTKRALRRIHRWKTPALLAFVFCLIAILVHRAYVISLGPKHEVLFKRGVALRLADDPRGAQLQFSQALALRPDFSAASFELARALIAQGEFSAARSHFLTLARKYKDPSSAAYLGYCFSRSGESGLAVAWYERAISRGCKSGEVLNNYAVDFPTGNSATSAEEKAQRIEDALEQALVQFPNSPTVKFNCIQFDLDQASKGHRKVTSRSLEYCRELMLTSPKCGELLFSAARLYCLAYPENQRRLDEACDFLELSFELGKGAPLASLLNDPLWSPLEGMPAFDNLLERVRKEAHKPQRGTSIPRYLEPVSCAGALSDLATGA